MRTLMLLLMIFACSASAQPDHDRPGAFVIGESYSNYSLDPARTSASIDLRILGGMYETLVIYGDDGMTLEPGAAESWEVSEDGLTYTFHLREDARWSNGDPVTANDFVLGWFRALLPDTAGDYAALYFPIDGVKEIWDWRLAQIQAARVQGEDISYEETSRRWDEALSRFDRDVGIEALDDHTLRITLAQPTPSFLRIIAMANFAPFPSEVFDNELYFYGDGGGRIDPEYFHDPEIVITNGPYRLAQFDEGEEVRLVANEHYWNAANVRSARIIQRAYDDLDTLLAAYEAGDIDWMPSVVVPEHRAALFESGRADVHIILNAGTYYYQFNCRAEVNGQPNPFADRDLRRALAHAFDRETIAGIVGSGTAPSGLFVPRDTMLGYESPDDAVAEYDLEEARRLLMQAGYDDLSELGSVHLLINVDGRATTNRRIAQTVADQFELLGLSVEIDTPEFIEYLNRSKAGNFQIRRAGWFGDYQDPTTFLDMLRSNDSHNDAGYESEAFDTLMASAAMELDREKRLAILSEAEALLLEDAVIVPLYQYVSMSLYDPERVSVPLNAWSYTRLEHLERLAD